MKTHRTIFGILLFILCLHLSLLFATRNSIIWSDAKQYDSYGWSIAQGNGYHTKYRPPAYPYFLGLVYWLFGHQPNVAKLIQIFLYLFLCYTVYLMGKLLFDEGTANLSALIVGTYPSLVGFNLILMSDNLFTLFLTLSVLTSMYFLSTRKTKFLIASGVLAGLATLTRTVGATLLVSLIIGLGVGFLRAKRASVWPVLLSILSFLAFVLPWTCRNYYVRRNPTFVDTGFGTGIGINLYMGNAKDTPILGSWKKMESLKEDVYFQSLMESGNDVERNRALIEVALLNIKQDPLLFAKRFLGKLLDLWGPERFIAGNINKGILGFKSTELVIGFSVASNSIYCFVLVFFVRQILRQSWDQAKVLVVSLIALYSSAYAIFFGHPHYHLPLIPIMSVYAAHSFREAVYFGDTWRQWVSYLGWKRS